MRLKHARWWGAGGGVLLALGDALLAEALGISFAINGRPAPLLTGAYFSLSLGTLGFLLGYVIEGRRRDQRAARIIRRQMETIHSVRNRLSQSEKLAALGQLAATIAHEVRNPLAVIRSSSQELARVLPADDEDARSACSFITDEIDRLSNVITSLLAFARPPQLDLRAVQVRDLLDHALLLTRPEFLPKRLEVRRHDAIALPAVRADADLIRQVVLGLLANAVEAVPDRGVIELGAKSGAGSVEITVADSGPGVPVELRSRVFEPFFTTRPGGTGLGLAIARQIVEAHGGDIAVGERTGGGAAFTLRLPAVSAR